MRRHITVNGEPQGKGRPRFGNGRTYTPQNTVEYEQRIKAEWLKQTKGYQFPQGTALSLEIKAYLQPPKSVSKKKQAAMLANRIRPKKKPDFDNIAKIIGDALNKTAYYDDSQIVFCAIGKYWGSPRVEITITEIEEVYP